MAADPIVTPDLTPPPAASRPKKPLVRREGRDRSQELRLGFQLAFVALNAWIGVQFLLWVRGIERGAAETVARPAGVEGWLPIASLMGLKAWILTGRVPRVHPAGMFLLVAFLAISLLLKKAFCSWLCPVGTLSEMLWKLGRRLFRRNFALPRRADVPLRGIKYLLLGFFVWAIARMSAGEIVGFLESPYGIVADVKLLNFFRFMGTTAVVVIAVLAVLSLLIQNFWCRYLCPYGALLGIPSLFSPARIRRDADACIDCAKCAKACPARLPVDTLPEIRSAECSLCMTCVAVCPAARALEVKVSPRHRLSAGTVAAAIAAIFLAVVIVAKASGHWETQLPRELYRSLVGGSADVAHPM